MKNTTTELIMLGTGSATVTRCFNTCFILKTSATTFLVDAGGGNGILAQLPKSGTRIEDIHDIFVTHIHTDHILGVVWVIRMVMASIQNGLYQGVLRVYGHDRVIKFLDFVMRMTLSEKDWRRLGTEVLFCEIKDKDRLDIGDIHLQCFDILSTKEKQFGFKATLPGGQSLVCLGDEPYNEQNHEYVANADFLMCEAFCLYRDREIFKPYAKHHSTAMEAGILAEQLKIKNLILYHTEDHTLENRRELYTEEAARNFTGTILVPDDMEKILID